MIDVECIYYTGPSPLDGLSVRPFVCEHKSKTKFRNSVIVSQMMGSTGGNIFLKGDTDPGPYNESRFFW